jgi:hypothetical protein
MTAAAFALLVALAQSPAAAQSQPGAAAAVQGAPATPEALLEAVRRGDLAGVRAALDAGVPVDTPFRYERTALSFAADRGNLDIVRLLLERGADPNKKDSFYGATAMTWASEKGSLAMVRLLVEHGAPADASLLETAVEKADPEFVAFALEKAKLTADDLAVALAAAQQAKSDAIATQLTKAGARPPVPADFAIDGAALAAYAGAYRDERGNELRFEVREGKLVCVNCSPAGMVLGAEDAVTFREPARPRPKLRFSLEDGKPSGCTLDFGSRQARYRRVTDTAPKEKP